MTNQLTVLPADIGKMGASSMLTPESNNKLQSLPR